MPSGWGWPEWAMAVLYGIGIGMDAFRHGQERISTTHNFWRGLVLTAASAWILHLGGFW